MQDPKDESLFFVDGKRVMREAFMMIAAKSGAIDPHGTVWETYNESENRVMICNADGHLFMTISADRPCLN